MSALLHTGMPMEFPYRANIGRADLANPTEAVAQGAYHFNGETGIGVEITKEALKEYGCTYTKGSWKPIQG
jgi:L-alanine-DL-glutamate epimerase-like enolase superfamily enzyme